MEKMTDKNLFKNKMRSLALAISALALLISLAPAARADDTEITPFTACQGNVKPTGWSDFHCPITGFVGRKPIDLLWVIDNSGSMTSYQQNLIQNAASFINALAIGNAPRWKIGVISTSTGEAPYVGFTPQTLLNYQTPNAVQVFQNTVAQLGIDGSDTEMTMTPVMDALDKYPDFLRPQANLGIVMVTDEREQSSVSSKDFLSYLAAKKGGDIRNVSTYGLYAAEEWNCDGDPYKGGVYEEIINGTNGKAYPLCQATPTLFADMMAKMLGDLRSNRLDLPANVDPTHLTLAFNSIPATILKEGPASAGGDYQIDVANHQLVISDINKYDLAHRFILSFKVH